MMVAFIDEHRAEHGVEPICKQLPIAPSTYFDHRAKQAYPAKLSARVSRCSIPDVCIDERRLPLFIARATLRGLIAVLEARATGDAAR